MPVGPVRKKVSKAVFFGKKEAKTFDHFGFGRSG
jgi:hypothetical protein